MTGTSALLVSFVSALLGFDDSKDTATMSEDTILSTGCLKLWFVVSTKSQARL